MRIGNRLFLSFFTIIFLEILIVVSGLINIHKLSNLSNDSVDLMVTLESTYKLTLRYRELAMPVNDYLVHGNIIQKEVFSIQADDLKNNINKSKEIFIKKGKNELAKAVDESFRAVQKLAVDMFKLDKPIGSVEGAMMMGNVYAYIDKVTWELDEYNEQLAGSLEVLRAKSMVIMRNAVILFLLFSLLGIVLSFLLSYRLGRRIHQPVVALKSAYKDLAAGKESEKIELKTNDEFQELADGFNKMSQELRKTYIALQDEKSALDVKVQERTKDLEQSQMYLKEITNGINEGIILLDDNFKILWANKKVMESSGCAESEIIGRRCHQFFHDSADPCQSAENYCPVLSVFKTGIPSAEVHKHKGKDGRQMYFEVVAYPLRNKNGDIKQFIYLSRDITERKRAEEEVRFLQAVTLAITESGGIHSALETTLRKVCDLTGWALGEVWTPDPSGDHLICNAAWYDSTGVLSEFRQGSVCLTFDPENGLPGRVWSSRKSVWIRDIAQDASYVRQAMAQKSGLKTAMGIPVLAGDEVIAVMNFHSFELRDDDEQLLALVSNVAGQLGLLIKRKEVEGKLKEAYDTIQQTQAQLVQSAKMASIGQLAAGLAHEINNPLTGVLNNIQLIKMIMDQQGDKFVVDAEFKDLLNIIEESATRCKNITQSLLNFSHVPKTYSQNVSLSDVIEKTSNLVGYELRLQNITVKTDFSAQIPLINGNPQLLQQVFMNFITNARWAIKKKAQEKGGTISIKTAHDPLRNRVDVSISDNGIGMAPEVLGRVFEPFFTTKDVGEGTGLGLSVIYGIIKEHKGEITVESKLGEGTTFKVSLPVMASQPTAIGL